ncbi:MAG: carbohydrate-binding domain-containing protein [Candidatus Zipacnadales bacterium]
MVWVLLGVTAIGMSQVVEREVVSLNGIWQFVRVTDLDAPLPTEGWQTIAIPGQLRGYNYERTWFRRNFACDVPAGRRVKLHFGGVKWNSRVFVNGTHVGGNFGGFEPFDLDITNAVRTGPDNELLVGVCDWTGVFVDRSTNLSDIKGVSTRDVPRDQALSMVGGLTENYGLWDDVKLVIHAPVYISDIFIKTSVKDKHITVDLTVTNEDKTATETTVSAEVERSEASDQLPTFKPQPLRIPAGESRSVTVEAEWARPHLWSHLDPHLYHLTTALSTGDVLRTRFGFREFEVRGPHFYLNGKKINLLATSWWPTVDPLTPEAIREQMRMMKYARCVAFRTHTQPWCERWYEIADEVGIMMIPEGAVWNDDTLYRLGDQRFWDQYARHLRSMVRRDKNKPSVVMWSLENEFYGGRVVEGSPWEEKLADMGRIVKEADPTRPILYESDGDPGGVADVIGLHYPHEYPNFVQWPNETDWLEKPIPLTHAFTDTPGEFYWKKNKPLYIGEFLWIPSADPSWDTVWFGDESYRDYQTYHVLAKAEAWKQQIIGYRRHEVAGISPWTMIEGGPLNENNPLVQAQRYAYQEMAAFPREYDSRFFAGETVRRTLDVFNDSFADRLLTIEWRGQVGDLEVPGGEAEYRLPSGAHEVHVVELTMPTVKIRTDGTYTVRVREGEKVVFEDKHPLNVFPHAEPLRVSQKGVGLYDPGGTMGQLIKGAVVIGDLADLPSDLRVLVIGGGALKADEPTRPIIGGGSTSNALSAWVEGGGRVILLEQTGWPRELIPAQLSSHASTMTFAQMPHHPLLADVRPADLKYWRGDHIVTVAEPVRPTSGAAMPVVVSGSGMGIAHAPLLVLPRGKGAYLICQLKLIEKAHTEPIASVLLRNLLNYAIDYPPPPGPTAVYCDLPATRAKLAELSLQADDVTGHLTEIDLSRYGLLVYASSSADRILTILDKLLPWIENGGNVLVHGLAPGEYTKLADVLDPSLKLSPYRGHALRGIEEDPLLFSFTNEDLYWLGEHSGHSWATTPLAQSTAMAAFERTLNREQVREFPAVAMELVGGIVGKLQTGDGVFFATVGRGRLPVDFPKSGEYVIGVVARGTPVDDIYPLGEVRVGGRSLGSISIRSNDWETYTTFGQVEAGTHLIEVAFTNDANKPPNQDRNMYLQSILVAPLDDTSRRSIFLTCPAALVRFPKGKGSVVIDEIAWDTEEANNVKATRFISGLLTGLGAQFSPQIGVVVEAEDLEPKPGMPYFSKGGGRIVMATNGYVAGEVEVARGGHYRITLVAGGSAAEGVYPIVEISMGESVLGTIELTSSSMRPYSLEADLTPGVYQLRITFTNDRNVGGEDRNLYVDRLVFYGPE